jgi:hypothetical protein
MSADQPQKRKGRPHGSAPPLSARHLAVIDAFMAGKPWHVAMRENGFSPNYHVARFLKRPLVKSEIEKRQLLVRQQSVYDSAAAVAELNAFIAEARAEKDYKAINGFMQSKLRVVGLWLEKQEIKSAGLQIIIRGVDDEPAAPALTVTAVPLLKE